MSQLIRYLYGFNKEDESLIDQIELPELAPDQLSRILNCPIEEVDYMRALEIEQSAEFQAITEKKIDSTRLDYFIITLEDKRESK